MAYLSKRDLADKDRLSRDKNGVHGGEELFVAHVTIQNASSTNDLASLNLCLMTKIGININIMTGKGFHSLYMACSRGHTRIVERLLAVDGIDVNLPHPKDGKTPLYIACNNNHIDIVKRLLLCKNIQLNSTTNKGTSSFSVACQNGHCRLIQILLDEKIDFNLSANNGATPFYFACQMGNIAVVKILLKAKNKIDIIKPSNNGTPPFFVLCQQGFLNIIQIMLETNEIVENINAANSNGATSFYIACQNGHLSVVNILLNVKNINANTFTSHGLTPLNTACANGHVEVVKRLLCLPGIDINQSDHSGRTSFFYACQNGHLKVVECLLDQNKKLDKNKKLDVNKCVKKYGISPIYIACQNGHHKLMKLILVVPDIDVNQANNEGQTPLHIACRQGHVETVDQLLTYAKDIHVNTTDNNGTTPLIFASLGSHTSIVRLLINQPGIDIRKKAHGNSALSIARENNDEEIVDLLLEFILDKKHRRPHTNYFGDCFVRPTTVPANFFASTVQSTKDGILRNGYNHVQVGDDRVRLINLKTAELNGKCGTKKKWDESKGRFQVLLDDTKIRKKAIKIKPENLETIVKPPCLHEILQPWESGWDPTTGWTTRKKWICDDCKMDLTIEKWDNELKQFDDVQAEDIIRSKVDHGVFIHSKGIKIEWLIAFANDHNCWNWPTWKVNRDIIKPATKETRCRFADLPELAEGFGPATVFASHAWGAKFGDLIGAMCHGARKDRIVWIDIFAVRQWPGNNADLDFRCVIDHCNAEIVSVSFVDGLAKGLMFSQGKVRGELTSIGDPLNTSFNVEDLRNGGKEIRKFFSTDEGKAAKTKLPFLRLWCVVEMAAAIERNIPVVIKGGILKIQEGKDGEKSYLYDTECGEKIKCKDDWNNVTTIGPVEMMMENLQHLIDLKSSECAVDADKERELKIIESLSGGIDHVNSVVGGVVTGSVVAIHNQVIEVDAAVCGEIESLVAKVVEIPGGCFYPIMSCCAGGRTNILRKIIDVYEQHATNLIVEQINQHPNNDVADDGDEPGERKNSMPAAAEINKNVIQSIVDGINKSNCVWLAASGGHAECLRLLFNMEGVNPNSEMNGKTALNMASLGGHLEVVDILLEAGSNVHQTSKGGRSNLFNACLGGHHAIVERLLRVTESGDINNTDDYEVTPLWAAIQNGHTSTIKCLLGCDEIDINQEVGFVSPIRFAESMGHQDIIQLLMNDDRIQIRNAEHEVPQRKRINKDGQTLLHIASTEGQIDVVRSLIRQPEIDFSLRDNQGMTALDYARQNNHQDIVEILTVAEASANGVSLCFRHRPTLMEGEAATNNDVPISRQLEGLKQHLVVQQGWKYEDIDVWVKGSSENKFTLHPSQRQWGGLHRKETKQEKAEVKERGKEEREKEDSSSEDEDMMLAMALSMSMNKES